MVSVYVVGKQFSDVSNTGLFKPICRFSGLGPKEAGSVYPR